MCLVMLCNEAFLRKNRKYQVDQLGMGTTDRLGPMGVRGKRTENSPKSYMFRPHIQSKNCNSGVVLWGEVELWPSTSLWQQPGSLVLPPERQAHYSFLLSFAILCPSPSLFQLLLLLLLTVSIFACFTFKLPKREHFFWLNCHHPVISYGQNPMTVTYGWLPWGPTPTPAPKLTIYAYEIPRPIPSEES